MGNNLEAQALRHKTEAVKALIVTNGLAQGFKRPVLRYVETWYATQSVDLLPHHYRTKVGAIFHKLISSDQLQRIDEAVALYMEGDDSELRNFIKGRVCVAIGSRLRSPSYGAPIWRSRKFSDPLFLTPAGFLTAYPEVDQDLFIDVLQANEALAFYRAMPNQFKLENASYQISEPAILGKIGGAGYRRWLEEVKGQSYTEPRRSLRQTHSIYLDSGREGLQKMYSPAYVFALMRKFNAEGLQVSKPDLDRIVHPHGMPTQV